MDQVTVEEEIEEDQDAGDEIDIDSKIAFQTSTQMLQMKNDQTNRSLSPTRNNIKVTPFMSHKASVKMFTSRGNTSVPQSH